VRWHGTIGLPEGIDLDQAPPSPRGNGDDIGTTSLYEISAIDTASIVSWPTSNAPEREDCAVRLTTYPSEYIVQNPPQSSYLCVTTSERRPARLKVGGLTFNGAYEFEVTVWDQ
jgi:hypothetical protein